MAWTRLKWLLKSLFRRERDERELEAEIHAHLEIEVQQRLDQGQPLDEAVSAAKRDFGNLALVKEVTREMWGAAALRQFLQDVRYSLRTMRKSWAFSATAVLTLALGIGANTGIFTLVDTVLLKVLPVPHPENLFLVTDSRGENSRFSYPQFQRLRDAMPPSVALAAMSWPASFYASAGDTPAEPATGQLVSGEYFQTLETYPMLGRLLTSEDNRVTGGHPVAVISYGYWKRRFAQDTNIIGRKFLVNNVPFTVVGVAPPGFFGATVGTSPDFWLPAMMQFDVRYAQHYSASHSNPDSTWIPQENITWLRLVVRTRNSNGAPQAGAAINQAYRVDLERLAGSIADPERRNAFLDKQLVLESISRGLADLRRKFTQPLLVLLGMVGLVLLIACANIASMLLAKTAARQREIAVRLSLGASRARLILQFLTESMVLFISGGILGIAVAYGCCKLLPVWASANSQPIPLDLSPDLRVFLFTAAIILATGILFGLSPALQATRVQEFSALRTGAATGTHTMGRSAKRWSLRKSLVAAQVAFSLVLLVGAGLFLRTLINFLQTDAGYDRGHLLSVWIFPNIAGYDKQRLQSLPQILIDRMEALPGVRSATAATCDLAADCHSSSDILMPSYPRRPGEQMVTQLNIIGPRYFETVGMPLLEGRDFAPSETEKAPRGVIVNQAFVRRFCTNKDALGTYFGFDSEKDHEFTIVGVVADARVNNIREDAPPMMYVPFAQQPVDIGALDIRTSADPKWFIPQVRQALHEVAPELPISRIVTLSDQVSSNLSQQRLVARLTAIFGALALGLACIGLYGVMSYNVARRTSELGVRMALGSTRMNVLWLVLSESLVITGAGLMAGLFLAIFAARLIRGLLFGLSPQDPVTLVVAVISFLAIAAASGLIPAWRASRLNPMEALRAE